MNAERGTMNRETMNRETMNDERNAATTRHDDAAIRKCSDTEMPRRDGTAR